MADEWIRTPEERIPVCKIINNDEGKRLIIG